MNPELLLNRKRNQIEMMRDRGYIIPDEEIQYTSSLDLFVQRVVKKSKGPKEPIINSKKLDNTYDKPSHMSPIRIVYILSIAKKSNRKKKRIIGFDKPAYAKLNKKKSEELMKYIINVYDGYKSKTGKSLSFILVRGAQIQPLADISNLAFETQFIPLDFFAINPTKHFLVDQHVMLTNEQKNKLLGEIKGFELPGISIKDPISVYYGARIHDIFIVIRNRVVPSYLEEEYYFREVRSISNLSVIEQEEMEEEPITTEGGFEE